MAAGEQVRLPRHKPTLFSLGEVGQPGGVLPVCVLSLNLFANVGSNTRRNHNLGTSIFAVSVIPCEKVLVTIVTILSAMKQLPKNGSS